MSRPKGIKTKIKKAPNRVKTEEIKKHIREAGYSSVCDFARSIGIDAANVRKATIGTPQPAIERMFQFAKGLKLPIEKVVELFYPDLYYELEAFLAAKKTRTNTEETPWRLERFIGDGAVYGICVECGYAYNASRELSNAEFDAGERGIMGTHTIINKVYKYCPMCGKSHFLPTDKENSTNSPKIIVHWKERDVSVLWGN